MHQQDSIEAQSGSDIEKRADGDHESVSRVGTDDNVITTNIDENAEVITDRGVYRVESLKRCSTLTKTDFV